MSSINKAIIVGHLGADPEIKYMQNGNPVCDLSVATSEKWTDKSGEKKEKTEWHRISVFGKSAEACAKYLAKGRLVYVEGRIETQKYDDKNGVTKYTTKIIANDVQFLGGGDKKKTEFTADSSWPVALADAEMWRRLASKKNQRENEDGTIVEAYKFLAQTSEPVDGGSK